MLPLKRLLKKYGWIGSFLAAITPFPLDDVVIILLGMVKLSPWKFIITNFAGKLISNLIVVWGTALTGRVLIEQIITKSKFYKFININC
jgi:membrane protein DedA with SNARE-associated domain